MALLQNSPMNFLLDPPTVPSAAAGSLLDRILGYPPLSTPLKWISLRQRFTQFHTELQLTWPQQLDAATKGKGFTKCLNRHYYDLASETANHFLIGSWGKDTAIRPPRDVDL